jgi:hypothetical protein
MLKMILDFGVSALPIVLVVSLTTLLLWLNHSSHLLQVSQTARPRKTGKFKRHNIEQCAGTPKKSIHVIRAGQGAIPRNGSSSVCLITFLGS